MRPRCAHDDGLGASHEELELAALGADVAVDGGEPRVPFVRLEQLLLALHERHTELGCWCNRAGRSDLALAVLRVDADADSALAGAKPLCATAAVLSGEDLVDAGELVEVVSVQLHARCEGIAQITNRLGRAVHHNPLCRKAEPQRVFQFTRRGDFATKPQFFGEQQAARQRVGLHCHGVHCLRREGVLEC